MRRKHWIPLLLVVAFAAAAVAATVTPIARAQTCDATGIATEDSSSGVNSKATATCTGDFYEVCLEAASQVSGWSSPFACNLVTGTAGHVMFSQYTSCVTAVFYRGAVKDISRNNSTYVVGPSRTWC